MNETATPMNNDDPLQIMLIRAGATEYERDGIVQGTLDVPLCDDGRREVTQVVDEIQQSQLDALYTTPCQAAQETGEAIGKAFDLKVRQLDAMTNLDYGLWQGMRIEDVKTKHPKVYKQWKDQPETVCPPQGETVAIVRARVAKVLLKLKKRHKTGVIGLVAPEPLASVVRHVLRNDELHNLWGANGGARWECIGVPNGVRSRGG